MSNYTSENTKVLATHMQAGNNKRMLLLHTMQSGSHEYIIGSYFTETSCARVSFDPPKAVNFVEYSWDWGHYFDTLDEAALYWLREIKRMRVEGEVSEA